MIGAHFNVGEATVNRWVARFRSTGSLEPLPHGQGPDSIVDEKGLSVLCALIDEQRDVTRNELAQAYLEQTGVSLSVATVEDTQEALKKPYRGLLRITARLIRQAEQACLCAREQLGILKKGAREKALRQVEYLERMTPRARQVVKQTRARVFRGITDSPKKIISLFEPYAQILRRRKPH
ncbi:MAG TPA: hypothetical protein VH877_08535 [Polyangia bacterium]|jgi:hypothetical protein|nr:hypothetical protein [Polyangia bacterium]